MTWIWVVFTRERLTQYTGLLWKRTRQASSTMSGSKRIQDSTSRQASVCRIAACILTNVVAIGSLAVYSGTTIYMPPSSATVKKWNSGDLPTRVSRAAYSRGHVSMRKGSKSDPRYALEQMIAGYVKAKPLRVLFPCLAPASQACCCCRSKLILHFQSTKSDHDTRSRAAGLVRPLRGHCRGVSWPELTEAYRDCYALILLIEKVPH